MKPNFKDINIKASEKASMSAAEWEKANHIAKNWTTPELIPVKPVYTADDLKGMEHLDYVAGIPPYLRGPYSAMHTSPLLFLTYFSSCSLLSTKGKNTIASPRSVPSTAITNQSP